MEERDSFDLEITYSNILKKRQEVAVENAFPLQIRISPNQLITHVRHKLYFVLCKKNRVGVDGIGRVGKVRMLMAAANVTALKILAAPSCLFLL